MLAAGGAYFFLTAPKPSRTAAAELLPFVHALPPVPIVFTSRSEPASLEPAAVEGEGFTYPGTIPWKAREGRLRLLMSDRGVVELTWNRELPEGGTLVDVMSPSVSVDGKRVFFAGRKAPPDAGRWRIFQVELETGEIARLTGGPSDPGCTALPPMRFAADGTRLSDSARKQLDYDDVDPTDLGPDGFAFASSRLPDLGRDHSRRATQIWVWKTGDAASHPITANRNNDRWPVLSAASDQLIFSLWSRNREAVTADRSEVQPVSMGGRYATAPTDHWMAAHVRPNGVDFGYAVKSDGPAWRPRPLFNGRLAYTTHDPSSPGVLRLAQADWGYIQSAPSSLLADMSVGGLNARGPAKQVYGPGTNAEGVPISAGTPAPCPGGRVLFSASPLGARPKEFALYSTSDDWTSAAPVPELLFDDPAYVDSEPVAVYAREVSQAPGRFDAPPATANTRPSQFTLASGALFTGDSGFLENLAVKQAIRNPIPWSDAPYSMRDPRKNPLVPPPPNVKSIVFYAAYRDRFDDPDRPRVPGNWEKLTTSQLEPGPDGKLVTWVPTSPLMTTVLAGLDAEGKVAAWNGKGNSPRTFFAYAGDHYSHVRPNGYHYCNGCHTGHTFVTADIHERVR
ncbi:hypothetical protein FRUB_00473 [Fimbriiglobus ruber]|uniref:Hydrazine synthase alpha subunit middle domain-containing protein n=1 Tax=Fimbriiglobus ruber TaxID=1908690 RepID=A0A225E4T3_9BACT|nr:hypothetical protein FRUB_00473 [Fimbriiglobus ruber]